MSKKRIFCKKLQESMGQKSKFCLRIILFSSQESVESFDSKDFKRQRGRPLCRQAACIQSNLDYPDSLGLDEIVRIIEGPDNRKYEY